MNEQNNPIFLLGKLVDKIERQDELLDDLIRRLPDEPAFMSHLQELRSFISADCDRLYAVLNQEYSPLHQFNELSREQANKYLSFAGELVNNSPEAQRRRTLQQLEDSIEQQNHKH